MRTSLHVSILLLTLMGCQQLDLYAPVWSPLEFEWVEPLIFQHNLQVCRSADVCKAEDLFD